MVSAIFPLGRTEVDSVCSNEGGERSEISRQLTSI